MDYLVVNVEVCIEKFKCKSILCFILINLNVGNFWIILFYIYILIIIFWLLLCFENEIFNYIG